MQTLLQDNRYKRGRGPRHFLVADSEPKLIRLAELETGQPLTCVRETRAGRTYTTASGSHSITIAKPRAR